MRPLSAFSLLEVLVAIALLALGTTALLQVQARSVDMAIQAREVTIGTMLARGKLYDCQTDLLKKGFSIGDYDEEGTFDDEGYPNVSWECHAYKPDMPQLDSSDAQQALSGNDTADAAEAQGADMAAGFLGPILTQMSSVMGDSIRELVVIVRWGEGADVQDITVTTHVIDKQPVTGIANLLSQQCGGGRNTPPPRDDDKNKNKNKNPPKG